MEKEEKIVFDVTNNGNWGVIILNTNPSNQSIVNKRKSANSGAKKDLSNIEKVREVLESESPITEFKKVSGKNEVSCSLKDGEDYTVPVDQYLQLFYDKIEMHPEEEVDFGRKNKVVVLPFQNRIIYIDGKTGKIKKNLPITSNLKYYKTDSVNGKHIEFSEKLNPAILSILSDDLAAQNDYVNATGNIDIIYNFDEKSDKITDNMSNKNLAKIMNNYYKSEKEYIKEL